MDFVRTSLLGIVNPVILKQVSEIFGVNLIPQEQNVDTVAKKKLEEIKLKSNSTKDSDLTDAKSASVEHGDYLRTAPYPVDKTRQDGVLRNVDYISLRIDRFNNFMIYFVDETGALKKEPSGCISLCGFELKQKGDNEFYYPDVNQCLNKENRGLVWYLKPVKDILTKRLNEINVNDSYGYDEFSARDDARINVQFHDARVHSAIKTISDRCKKREISDYNEYCKYVFSQLEFNMTPRESMIDRRELCDRRKDLVHTIKTINRHIAFNPQFAKEREKVKEIYKIKIFLSIIDRFFHYKKIRPMSFFDDSLRSDEKNDFFSKKLFSTDIERVESENQQSFKVYNEFVHPLPLSVMEPILQDVIDDDYIEASLEIERSSNTKQFIPYMKRGLERWKGMRVLEAFVMSRKYSNCRRARKIYKKEIQPLDKDDYLKVRYLIDHNGNAASHKRDWLIPSLVYKYLQGFYRLNRLHINKTNSARYLYIAKLFDLVMAEQNCLRIEKESFNRSSYNLRLKILELCPEMKSYWAFTKTPIKSNMNSLAYWIITSNWVDERVAIHARMLINTHIIAKTLSDRLSTIIAARGNTGSGKSTALSNIKGFIGNGVLNTDPIKWGLRQGTLVKNAQVHDEGSKLIFGPYFNEIVKRPVFKYMVDLRLIQLEKVKYYVLDPAKMRADLAADIRDFDVPLSTSLNRVLTRDPFGKEPCPTLDVVVDGYRDIRKHRECIIKLIKEEDVVKKYQLYYRGQQVAKKKSGKFFILDKKLHQECLRIPSKKEIEQQLSEVITDEYISQAISRHDIREDQRGCLEKWKGFTLRDAFKRHICGE